MANAEYVESAVDTTVALTTHDTEYSLTLPGQVKCIEIQAREASDIRMAFETGKVAGSTDPYMTIKSGTRYVKDFAWIGKTTLYFACAADTKNVEVRYWL